MSVNTLVDLPSAVSLPQSITETITSNVQEHDERSSSLSDIGDAKAIEETHAPQHSDIEGSLIDDTEAETERLEDSPVKQRKYQHPTFAAADDILSDGMDESGNQDTFVEPNDQIPQTSDISSVGELSEADADRLSSPPSTRKRKRPSLGEDNISDTEYPTEAMNDASQFASQVGDAEVSPAPLAEAVDHNSTMEVLDKKADDTDLEKHQQALPSKQKYKKGKRKGKKPREDKLIASPGPNDNGGSGEKTEALYSDHEDVENEDAGYPEQDNVARTEEGLIKKRSAMDSLSALEKCFATLRDRLFDERMTQTNEELALLEQPVPSHPELLAMKEAIDHRRDQKVEYERTYLRLKLESLQRESIAKKHQAQSQYMQTVRDIRDRSLDQLNKESYQVQRERRSWGIDPNEQLYVFSDKRSQQISQQRAYNKEVSVLSGIAKHVGFPAAPGVDQAKPKEVEDDFRKMGIATQTPRALQNHAPPLRASLSAASSFPRQKTAADEYFLEQNPWANPPAQYQQRQQVHRQVSALSGVATPSSTSPALQRRVVDLTQTQGSASTIAEPHSGPSSSVAPTPATGEGHRVSEAGMNTNSRDRLMDATPSRIVGLPIEPLMAAMPASEGASHPTKALNASKAEQPTPSLIRNAAPRDNQTPSSLPKPLPFTQGSRSSTPIRFAVKVEDGPVARQSPILRLHGPPAVSTTANGHTSRFT